MKVNLKKSVLVLGAATTLVIAPLLYAIFTKTPKLINDDFSENLHMEVMPVSLTKVKDGILPSATEETKDGDSADTNNDMFDSTGGHAPDTNLALMRFCASEEMMAAWSKEVATVRRFVVTENDEDLLVLTYLTGDWMVLSRDSWHRCFEIDSSYLKYDLQSIDDVITPRP